MTREECLCVNQQTIFFCQYPKGGYVFFPLKDVTVFDYLFDAQSKGFLAIYFLWFSAQLTTIHQSVENIELFRIRSTWEFIDFLNDYYLEYNYINTMLYI